MHAVVQSLLGPKGLLILLACAALLTGGILIGGRFSRPKVSGDTPDDRIRSVCRLADEKPAGAKEAIVEAARSDPDPAVRQAAYGALGKFLAPEDRGLLEAGTASPQAAVRAGAVRTLAQYGDDAAAQRVVEVLSKDPDQGARRAAAQALGGINRPAATLALVQAMESDSIPAVQREAVAALYAKMNARVEKLPDPSNTAAWRTIIQHVRKFAIVQDALSGRTPPSEVPR